MLYRVDAHGLVWTIILRRMSVNMTTHAMPHSLPSFASTFPPMNHQTTDKARRIHRSPSDRALSRNPSDDDVNAQAGRKRPHIDEERREDPECVWMLFFSCLFVHQMAAERRLPLCG